MRTAILLLPLALIASPAMAAAEPEQIPRELTDARTAERLAETMQALSETLLELPVGEIQAAAEGRAATAADKARTLRDLGSLKDPDFEKNLERQIAQAKPAIEQGMKALAQALPAMMKGLAEAERSLERATANLPRPDYPKR